MMCASCAFTLLVIKDGQFSRLNEKIKVQRGEISFLLSLHNDVGRIFTSMTFNICCYSYECVISYGKRAFTNVIKFTNILTWKYRDYLGLFWLGSIYSSELLKAEIPSSWRQKWKWERFEMWEFKTSFLSWRCRGAYIKEMETLILRTQETEFWEQAELAWKQILPQLLQKGIKPY